MKNLRELIENEIVNLRRMEKEMDEQADAVFDLNSLENVREIKIAHASGLLGMSSAAGEMANLLQDLLNGVNRAEE